MAIDAFIKIGNIQGESQDQDHKGWIDVLSFSLEAQAGKKTPPSFHFVKEVDKASPALFTVACGGPSPAQAVFSTRQAGGGGGKIAPDFLKITMKEVFISSMALSGNTDGTPTELLSLRFSEAAVDVNGAPAPGVCVAPRGHDDDHD